jgi:AmmeMemoRadiSam system protein A
MVSKEDQASLMRLARHSIQAALQKGRKLPVVGSLSPLLREKRGVFVTLWLEGLRGCIGFPQPVLPLGEAVQEAAVSAALRDPRFPPVTSEEFQALGIEISVLTPPRSLDPSRVKVGVHGLIVSKGGRSGLLLPQVAMEYRWDAWTFLDQTCVKAGLPKDAWRKGAEVLAFEAQVFSEDDLKGK